MARAAKEMPGSGIRRRLRGIWLSGRLAAFSLDDPRSTTALAHYAALAASLAIVALHPVPHLGDQLPIWGAVVAAFSFLRMATLGRRLSTSTVLLDAGGMAVFLAGTNAPGSPFFLFVLAGVWWAAHVRPPRGGLVYGVGFAIAYVLLVFPVALRVEEFSVFITEVTAVIVIGGLCDWFVGLDRRALAMNEAIRAAPVGMEQLAIREGLMRALGSVQVPVDVVLTAGQLGLTADQAELLSYLVLGLSNLEIADAMGASEATVRYRLTRLYRALGVRGRRAAAVRAHELGISGPSRTHGGLSVPLRVARRPRGRG
jgi:DNA-binding CsgD family transcriptional regulator